MMHPSGLRPLLAAFAVAIAVTPSECIDDPKLPVIFYPFGTDQRDSIAQVNDDGFTPAVQINGGFPFFSSQRTSVFVNTNGALTFGAGYGSYTPQAFPLSGLSLIAPYWCDVDTRMNDGRIYFRQSTDADLLSRASKDIQEEFSTKGFGSFVAKWVFVVTWHNVTYYGGTTTTPTQSFQCVLITDGTSSFVMFNYGTLKWTTGRASGGNPMTGLGGIPAQVGFNFGDATNFFAVPQSRTGAIVNIHKSSNVGITGRWVFRVDSQYIVPAGCTFNPTCTLNSATGLCQDSAVCYIQGDPHIMSYDGKRFDYQGTCRYLIASPALRTTTPYFQVFGRNENRYGEIGVSYLRYLEIVYGSVKIRLSRLSPETIGTVNVTVNGVPVSVPYCMADYTVFFTGLFVRFQTKFGLVVEFDGFSQAIVYVPPKYNNGKMTGICGNFNGNAADDLLQCNGIPFSGTPHDKFGDACVVNDTDTDRELSCIAPPHPTSPCITSPPKSYIDRCGPLKNTTGPFGACIAAIERVVAGSSTILYNNCIMDACLSVGNHICSNVRAMVDECAMMGQQVDCNAWQVSTGCSMTCRPGSGMVYQCNPINVCLPTCDNPIVPKTCTRPNRGACVCPDGKLLSDGVCVSVCPGGCVDLQGKLHPIGDKWTGPDCSHLTCVACPRCPNGAQLNTTSGCSKDEVCRSSACVPTPPDVSICSCFGDPHCKTFDDLLFDYQGTCKYLMAGVITSRGALPGFQIFARNDRFFSPDDATVSYVSYVEVVFDNGDIVRLTRDSSNGKIPVMLLVNNFTTPVPYHTDQYDIDYSGRVVQITTAFGVSIEYDGLMVSSVSVPRSYADKLTGICGNNDRNATNDWTTRNGSDVLGVLNGANILGDSFIVDDTENVGIVGCVTPAPPGELTETTCPQLNLYSTVCAVLQSPQFTACANVLGVNATSFYFNACVLDGCVADSSLIACGVIRKFFEECSRLGVTVSCTDWQSVSGCGFQLSSNQCPVGMIYQCDAPACQATCSDPDAPGSCSQPNRESCVCPSGKLLSNGVCVDARSCPTGCMDDNGLLRRINETWVDSNTCATKQCLRCTTCAFGGSIQTTQCGGKSVCVRGTCVSDTVYCSCSGDPHCRSFDSLRFDYQGLCKHNFASINATSTLPAGFDAFQIYVRNEPSWSPAVSTVRYVEVVYGEHTVRIARNPSIPSLAIPVDVTIDGKLAQVPYVTALFRIQYSGLVVRYQTNFGLVVEYDGEWTLTVIVPREPYHGLVWGLCGNNDGSPNNDWTTAYGTDVSRVADRENQLGDSFVVADSENTAQSDSYRDNSVTRVRFTVLADCRSCQTPVQPPLPSACKPAPAAHRAVCGLIGDLTGPFQACVRLINTTVASLLVDACLMDACYSSGASLCNSVIAFVEECLLLGVDISCQTFQSTRCGSALDLCPKGMIYQCDATGCPATCAQPDAPRTCSRPAKDACRCPDGQFLFRGSCTASCPAGCVDENKQFHEVGKSWRGQGCNTFTCTAVGQIRQTQCGPRQQCSNDVCVEDSAVCECYGDPHCDTFDRVSISYQGICRYNLVSVNASADVTGLQYFEIYSKNEFRYGITSVSYVKYVEISLGGGDVIRLVGDYSSKAAVPVAAMVNYEQVQLPFIGSTNSYYLRETGRLVHFETSFGLVVEFDGTWHLSVSLPRTAYRGKVFGLCGNNDDVKSNDLTKANGVFVGRQEEAGKLIGDSYVVVDLDVTDQTSCPAPPPPQLCTASTDVKFNVYKTKCTMLKNTSGVFAQCVNALGVDASTTFYDNCLLDACITSGSSFCPTVGVFVDRCAALGFVYDCTLLTSAAVGCGSIKTTCPVGMMYVCDAPGCQATCAEPNPGFTCTLPRRGACVCPSGTLLHNGKCVDAALCPRGCVDENLQLRPIGSTWFGPACTILSCVACPGCAFGAQIQVDSCPSSTTCVNGACVKPSASCTCHGDPHCKSFDDKRFDYQGTCRYNLASVVTSPLRQPPFAVFAEFENRFGKTDVSWVKSVDIVIGTDTISLVSDYLSPLAVQVNVLLNNAPLPISRSYSGAAGYIVSNYGRGVRFDAPSVGLIVTFDAYKVNVTVSVRFAGQLQGLCGNYDGNPDNDLTTPTGVDVSGRPDGDIIFGDSFVVRDPADIIRDASCVAPPMPPKLCVSPAEHITKCGVMVDTSDVVFGRCVSALGPAAAATMYAGCLLDACNTDGRSLCMSIKNLVEECEQLNIAIPCGLWQQLTECGANNHKCPAGMTYECRTSGCQPTCDNPLANRSCALPDTDACVCPKGQLLQDGVCTSLCPSGCVGQDGLVHTIGRRWKVDNCMTATCVACDDCPFNARVQLEAQCCSGQRCVDDKCVAEKKPLTPSQIRKCQKVTKKPVNKLLQKKCNKSSKPKKTKKGGKPSVKSQQLEKRCVVQQKIAKLRDFCANNA